MIQIRNVPDELHRLLKARAAMEGKTLSGYLLDEVRLLAEKPTPSELRRRLAGRTRPAISRPPAEVLREERDRR